METLKYRVIKSEEQYYEYCDILENLVSSEVESEEREEEIELLTLLIEEYDREHSIFRDLTPVEVLESLMNDHHLRQKDIAEIAGVGKSYISEIMNYKKAMSKDVIRKLSAYFKVNQEAFNRPYKMRLTDKQE